MGFESRSDDSWQVTGRLVWLSVAHGSADGTLHSLSLLHPGARLMPLRGALGLGHYLDAHFSHKGSNTAAPQASGFVLRRAHYELSHGGPALRTLPPPLRAGGSSSTTIIRPLPQAGHLCGSSFWSAGVGRTLWSPPAPSLRSLAASRARHWAIFSWRWRLASKP